MIGAKISQPDAPAQPQPHIRILFRDGATVDALFDSMAERDEAFAKIAQATGLGFSPWAQLNTGLVVNFADVVAAWVCEP